MRQNSPNQVDKYSGEEHFLLDYGAIIVMMVTFTMVLVNAIKASVSDWNGSLLIFLSIVITLESLVSFRTLRQTTIFEANPIATRITEWIVILIGIKVLSYLFTSPGQFITDLTTWQEDFSNFFFQGDYLVICIFLFFIWILTNGFAKNLSSLGEDVNLLELERQGFAHSNRSDTRRGLMGLIFGMGSLMVFLTTVTQIKLPFFTFFQNPLLFNVVLIMLFFVSGFFLLSRSQLIILKARWYIEGVAANPDVGTRWMIYALVLILSIALIVIFLPTNYSLGILDIFRYIFQFFLKILAILQIFIFAPIVALLSLIARLLGGGQAPSPQSTLPPPVPTPAPTAISTPDSFLELIKSIIFWVVFILVVFFAFRHYILNHRGMVSGFQKFFAWLNFQKAWEWLRSHFGTMNKNISALMDRSLQRVRSLINPSSIRINPIERISRLLPARQRVMLIYLSMIQWNSRNGINRKKNQTPYEYARILNEQLPDHINDIDSITRIFIEARYTRHSITNQQAAILQKSIDQIQSAIRAAQDIKKQFENQV